MITAILKDPRDLLFGISAIAPAARAILAATLVIGLAGMTALLAWRASASLRHAVWLLALGAALVAALVSTASPVIEIRSSTVVNGPAVVPFDPAFFASLGTEPRNPVRVSMNAPLPTPTRTTLDWMRDHRDGLVLALWMVVALAIVARCLAAHLGIARMIGRARSIPRDRQPLVERAARLAGVKEAVDVRISDEVEAPFTIGAWNAVVLLPTTAATWSAERFHIVLVHELAHVARLDYVAQLVGTVACAVYWFNPVVWIAASRLRAEAEQAADDRVLSAGVDGVTYASHLLELARPIGAAPLATIAAVGMARSTRLERRFKAMLDSTRSRGTVPLRLQAAGGIAVMFMAIPLVGFRVVPAQQPAPSASAVTSAATATPTMSSVSPVTSVATATPTVASVATMTSAATATPTVSSVATETSTTAHTTITTPTTTSTSTATGLVADTVIEKTLAAAAGERIDIDLPTGGAITIQSWDQPRVRMRALLSGNQSRETRVDFDRTSGGLTLRTSVDYQRREQRNSNEFELWVPRRFNVHISSAGGGIRIANVEGRFSGQTGGGEIILDNVKGDARLSTGGGELHLSGSDLSGSVTTGGGEATVTSVTGDVRVSSGSGPVIRAGRGARSVSVGGGDITVGAGQNATIVGDRVYYDGFSMSKAGGSINLESVPAGGVLSTGGGDITIGSSGGKLRVSTGGGSIDLGRMGGDVVATTGAGNVSITVVNTDGTSHSVEVHSGSGRVTIDLPANIDAQLDLETAYTETHSPTKIESAFAVNVTETQEWDYRNGTPRRYVRATGTAGSGRGLIRIRTVNGDVVIRRR